MMAIGEMRLKAKREGKKFCNKCLITKEKSQFYKKGVSSKTGESICQPYCKICMSNYVSSCYKKRTDGKVRRIRKFVKAPEGKKICNRCEETKDLTNFYTCGKTKGGLTKYAYICKVCNNKEGRERRANKLKTTGEVPKKN